MGTSWKGVIVEIKGGSRGTVVVCWTAGQQVEQVINHLEHDSYQKFISFAEVISRPV